jgi:hypothetical protein
MATQIDHQPSRELKAGIRGWLLAFVVWLGIVSPVWTLGLSILIMLRLQQANPGDAALMQSMGWDTLLWLVTILRACSRVAVGLLMYFRRTAGSVWTALAVLWLSGPLLIVGPWAVLGGEINIPGLVRSAAIALAWSIFLLVSRRVKVTYGFRANT